MRRWGVTSRPTCGGLAGLMIAMRYSISKPSSWSLFFASSAVPHRSSNLAQKTRLCPETGRGTSGLGCSATRCVTSGRARGRCPVSLSSCEYSGLTPTSRSSFASLTASHRSSTSAPRRQAFALHPGRGNSGCSTARCNERSGPARWMCPESCS